MVRGSLDCLSFFSDSMPDTGMLATIVITKMMHMMIAECNGMQFKISAYLMNHSLKFGMIL